MSKIEKFEDLEIWKLARILCGQIFELTNKEGFSKDFSLKDQIRRSGGSIMDNIAEGFERDGNKEFIQFLSIAKGSTGEVKSQLYRAFDFKYISEQELIENKELASKIGSDIANFMKYLRKSEYKGIKYK